MQEVVKKIIEKNNDLFGNNPIIDKINVGFTNTIYNVNDKFIIKICSDVKNEPKFQKEIDFYNANKDNDLIPKLYYFDNTKNDVPYFYENIEKIEGITLYNVWHTFNETERENIIKQFTEKKGEIITGIIQKVDKNIVVLDLGKVEGIMPIKEQIPGEVYKVNQKIRTCISSVERGLKGAPQIILSRTSNQLVKKLFELEIPEIYEGLIEIKSISRDPGKRCKVAVYSSNENIDPVGSCVGQKGVRIQNIIDELHNEKIDVIEWNEDPSTFIAESLLPAQVLAVDLNEEEKFAQVIVADDQLSLAIGKSGQNARLAARLTNWKIDIKSESQFKEIMMAQMNEEAEVAEEVEPETVAEVEAEPVEEVVEEAPKKRGRKKKEEKEEE